MDNKTAGGVSKNVAAQVAILVASGMLGRAAYDAVGLGMGHLDRTTNMRRHWEKINALYPEEMDDNKEQNKRNYEAIYRVAPTLAKIPQITIHYLRQAKDYSTGGFDPSTIETLAKTEAAVSATQQKRFAPIRELTPDMRNLGDALGSSASISTLPIGLSDLLMG